MGYIEAQCSNCGAQLEINEEKGRGYCPHCGTLFVAEKITNKQVYSTTQNITKNIYGREKTEAEEYNKNGDVFISLSEYEKAKNAYDKAIELNPADWRGWFGMVKVKTRNFSDYSDTSHLSDLQKAHSVANDEDDRIIEGLYEQFSDTRRALLLKAHVDGYNKNSKVDNYYDFSAAPAADVDASVKSFPYTPTPAFTKSSYSPTPAYNAAIVQSKLKKHNKKGCIIVSVLLAILIISLLITGIFSENVFKFSYATITNNNSIVITGLNTWDRTIEIPEKINDKPVIEIESRAFEDKNIKNITLPSTLRTIGSNAFKGCDSLQYIRLKGFTPPTLGYNVFNFSNTNFIIYVPSARVHVYRNAQGWSSYSNFIQAWNG
ncbi:MAG TPA: leucine-rich repeat protein [Clostridia bacterium]|nr:leucine-rich repeat protein [Clostridia bacterium]